MIKLELTLDEVNVVLNTLGNLPYSQVSLLIEKIRGQSIPQLQQQTEPAPAPAEPVEQPKE
jgi:hypothetical protein